MHVNESRVPKKIMKKKKMEETVDAAARRGGVGCVEV